ncbi:hypothetical protein GCM10025865_10750 [Paraoerskovia sediminicola]|uniref:Major facilitator superfamily (MFS) profile domain-containing protein n=1 Tax=Paraoerskovia sediminicola TaxID=1138587 RepID=A0ABM8G149_9CELL|nr:MFS transporter [Paraoerskovia sediminicola]BDZ41776.1 hypothetical protein GCM10025865_10750 [Paraoerskovia sediminicola]
MSERRAVETASDTSPQGAPQVGRGFVPGLVYAALSAAIVSSLGLLLVPTIGAEFAVPVSTAQWTLTVNLLVGAIATPVLGRLSDGPHKRGILLATLAVILAGSVIAATAQSFAWILVGRALQGLSFAITPMAITLARRYAPPPRCRARSRRCRSPSRRGSGSATR